jgi:predicted enzyme related to lactoylglutathione lyase
MKNAINWFEIPAKNFDKAKKFYEEIFGTSMQSMEAMGMKSAFFSIDMKEGIGGCITQGQGYEPSDKGTVIYLNGGDDLSLILNKVEKAGGKILMPKTAIGENGFMAHFLDCEGNRIGLHSMK